MCLKKLWVYHKRIGFTKIIEVIVESIIRKMSTTFLKYISIFNSGFQRPFSKKFVNLTSMNIDLCVKILRLFIVNLNKYIVIKFAVMLHVLNYF